MLKPRIKPRMRPYGPGWSCRTDRAIGIGLTMEAAYKDWICWEYGT